jgi:aryl-alcohol dehydrogenase-like predicted oxidoreductase
MQYRELGRTKIKVSEIGFGAWGIGGWGPTDDAESLRALNRAFDLGVTFYDTAYVYGDGHSEELIGKAFADRRDKVIIASKVPPQTMKWPVREDEPVADTFSREWIRKCTETSLNRLGTDYLDVQQLHAFPAEYVAQLEWYDALQELKEEGKIRAFGCSAHDWDPFGPVEAMDSSLLETVQVIYNIFEQRPENKLLPTAQVNNVGIIARVPFEEGLLTGTIGPDTTFPKGDWRNDWLTPERKAEAAERVEALKQFLGPNCPTLPALALKFCLSHPAVSSVIPGMRSVKHVEANCAVSDGKLLSEETRAALKSHAFTHGWAYPWSRDA